MIRLRLLTRPGCHLCEAMRKEVDALLEDAPRQWETVNVDADASLSSVYGEQIPVLFVNDRLFARFRLPRLATRLRLLRASLRR